MYIGYCSDDQDTQVGIYAIEFNLVKLVGTSAVPSLGKVEIKREKCLAQCYI